MSSNSNKCSYSKKRMWISKITKICLNLIKIRMIQKRIFWMDSKDIWRKSVIAQKIMIFINRISAHQLIYLVLINNKIRNKKLIARQIMFINKKKI